MTMWTKERIAQLCELRDQGFSAEQIAAKIGVTRNAVIGKVNRLGLVKQDTRPKTVRKLKPHIRNARLEPAVQAKPLPLPVLDSKSDAPVTLLDLEPHHCRWPVSDAPFMFCGGAKQDGSSYCEYHADIAKRGVASAS
jgi:GcrA cell cycle regulator